MSFAQEGVRSSIENDTDTSSWAHLYVFSMIFVNSAISHQRLELIAAHARSRWSLRRVQAPEYGARFAATDPAASVLADDENTSNGSGLI